MRKQVIALYGLIALAFILFALLIWGPPSTRVWIKDIVTKQLTKYLGSQVEFSDIRFSVIPPAVELDNIKYSKDSGPFQSLSAERIRLTMGLSPSISGRVRIKKVEVMKPELKFDFSKFKFEKGKKTEKKTFQIPTLGDFLKVQIDEIQVSNTALQVELPGKYFLEINSDNAGYSRTKGTEFWSWNGQGQLQKGRYIKKLEKVSILAKRNGQNVEVVHFALQGEKNSIQVTGQAYPEANLIVTGLGESHDLFNALRDMNLVDFNSEVAGTYHIQTRLNGPWDNLKEDGICVLESIIIQNRKFDSARIQFQAEKNMLKKAVGEIDVQGAKVNFELSNFKQNQTAHYKVHGEKLKYNVIQESIDPTTTSILNSFLNISTEGELNIKPFSMQGRFHIDTPSITFDFPPILVPYFPLELKQIGIEGKLNWTRANGAILDGNITAAGFTGPYKISFPEKSVVLGGWDFNVTQFGDIFTKDYPVTGKGKIKGNLRVSNGNLLTIFSPDIHDLQYNGHEKSELTGDIVFNNFGTELSNIQLNTQSKKGFAKFQGRFGKGDQGESLVDGQVKNFDLSWISDMVSRRFPFVKGVSGRGSSTVLLQGSTNNMEGNITFDSTNMDWRNQHFNNVTSRMHLQPAGLTIQSAKFTSEDMEISAHGDLLTKEYRDLSVKATKVPLTLLGMPSWLGHYFESADANFVINGDIDDPKMTLKSQLFLTNQDTSNMEQVGTLDANGTQSKLDWNLVSYNKRMKASGTLDAKDHILFSGNGDFNKFPVLSFLPFTDSSLSGQWNFTGDLENIKTWDGKLSVASFDIKNSKLNYKINTPFQVTASNGVFNLTPFVLGDKDAHLAIRGKTDESQNLSFAIDGKVPMSLFTLLPLKLTRSDGVADVNLMWSGKLQNPILNGSFSTTNAYLQNQFWPHPLEDLNLTAEIDQNRIRIKFAQGKMSDGDVNIKGDLLLPTADAPARIFLNGSIDQSWIRFPDWLPILISGNFIFEGELTKPLLKGDFVVLEGTYKDDWDWKKQILTIGETAQTSRVYKKNEENILFDLSFRSENGKFTLRNNLANATMKADLRLLGSNLNFGLLGQIQILDGEVTFLDRKFVLAPGVINFTDENKVETSFDLSARTTIENTYTDIFLDIRTEGDQIRAYLSSNPVKDETTIVSLLTLGVELDDLAVTSNANQGVSLSLIPSVLSGPVQSRVETGLRKIKLIDSFQFVPYFSEATKSTSMRLVVQKKLYTKLRLSYSTDVFNSDTGNLFSLEHLISPNVKVLGSFGNLIDQTEFVTTENQYNLGLDMEFRFDF